MSITKVGLYTHTKKNIMESMEVSILNLVVFCQELWRTPAYEMCFLSLSFMIEVAKVW